MRLFVVLCLAVAVLRSHGVMLVPMSIEEMAERSSLVLKGRVLREECRKDDVGRIYTRIELQVEEAWKGTPASNPIVLVHGGGSLGGKRVTISDQVEFSAGEEVVAFLVLNQRGEGVSLGLAQGKFSVWTAEADQKSYAFNPFHGLPPPLRSPDQRLHSSKRGELLSLEVLKLRVRGGRK